MFGLTFNHEGDVFLFLIEAFIVTFTLMIILDRTYLVLLKVYKYYPEVLPPSIKKEIRKIEGKRWID